MDDTILFIVIGYLPIFDKPFRSPWTEEAQTPETSSDSGTPPVKMNDSTPTPQLSTIVQELNEACGIISNSDLKKEAARLRAISAAKDLVAKLENPAETILRDAFSV